jgi:integrase
MGWQHISDGAIAVKQVKTGVPLLIPLDIDPLLPEALQSAPKTNMTFLVAKSGAPISPRGFTSWFRLKCNDAGLPECSAHGLRKLVATRLANIGCSEDEIKAITSCSPPVPTALACLSFPAALSARRFWSLAFV